MGIAATLPVKTDDGGLFLDAKEARAFGALFAEAYRNASPFPHIVIDDFLPCNLAEQLLVNFPATRSASDKMFAAGYIGHRKRQILPASCNAAARGVFAFFNGAEMLQFLEGLTGISGLVSDPYYFGGGYHEIAPGGLLGIHADFRLHEPLNLRRRLNALIYLNRDWDPAWGGQLELWDRSMKKKVQVIDPIFNRCVVFSTDAHSFHGHPDPLKCPEGVTRKSAALYYYTASERVREEVPAHNTMYHARPGESDEFQHQARRSRTQNYLRDWTPPALTRILKRRKEQRRHSNLSEATSIRP